jgi:hypothetical protein
MNGDERISITLDWDSVRLMARFENLTLSGLLFPAYCGDEMASDFLGVELKGKELYDTRSFVADRNCTRVKG